MIVRRGVLKKMLNITLLVIAILGALVFWKPKIFGKKSDRTKAVSGTLTVLAVLTMFLMPTVIPDWVGGIKLQSAAGGLGNKDLNLAGACPTDGDVSVKVNVYNPLNTSGSENFDATTYIMDDKGVIQNTISDTTSPTAETLNCGETYTIAVVASDSDGGDDSLIRSTNLGSISDGRVTFKADRSNMNFNLEVAQHGVLEFALYDNVDARFSFDTSDASATGYEGDGVTFRDGDNATAFAVGAAGKLDFTLKLEGTAADTSFGDYYTLVAVEAPVSEYQEPQVKYDGVTLLNIKGSLTADEVTQFADYEYVYKITDKIQSTDTHELGFKISATSADPSTDLQIDFASAGNYKATSSQTVKNGAAKDDSSHSVVYTVQDVTIDVS